MENDRIDPVARLRADLEFETDLPGGRYRFATTWGLFSPREIDAGSRLLLRHVEVAVDADCVDIGCGYGVGWERGSIEHAVGQPVGDDVAGRYLPHAAQCVYGDGQFG